MLTTTATDEKTVLTRLTALCARRECCQGELLQKMRRWGVEEEVQARVMQYLTVHCFVDDERYARAFVTDKLLYNRWGRVKTDMALRAKGISEDIRRRVLAAVSDSDYTEQLRPLLERKARQLTGEAPYARRNKLLRFAVQRGYTIDQARSCIDRMMGDTGTDPYDC
ncbi:MAG: RecX family transcriptional regulator [Prevotella sp.]|nr:RecX family transcriptional regulator [Prevotella sp.]